MGGFSLLPKGAQNASKPRFGVPGGPPGPPWRHQKSPKNRKIEFLRMTPKPHTGPQKSKTRPGNAFFDPQTATRRGRGAPGTAWARRKS